MKELKAVNILTSKNVLDLKKYIYAKYAQVTSKEKAYILADAIRKTLSEKIPKVEKSLRTNLIDNIIKNSVNQASFDINSEDIFIECLNLKGIINEDAFLSSLCSWLNEVTARDIEKEKIKNFIHDIYTLDVTACNSESISIALKDVIQEEYKESEDNNIPYDSSELYYESGQISKESAIAEGVIDIPVTPFYKSKLVFKNKIRWFNLKEISIGMTIVILMFSLKINIFEYNYLTESSTNNTKSHKQNISEYIPIHIIEKPKVDENKSQNEKILIMKATAYDLSIKSCSKSRNHPMYGITFTGTKATKGRTVAVDPAVIPLGSKLHIKFPKSYSNLDGIYTAEDTGSKIKGNSIDIFFGEDKIGESIVNEEANNFGIRMVEVRFVK